jgi:hypothetical protein
MADEKSLLVLPLSPSRRGGTAARQEGTDQPNNKVSGPQPVPGPSETRDLVDFRDSRTLHDPLHHIKSAFDHIK